MHTFYPRCFYVIQEGLHLVFTRFQLCRLFDCIEAGLNPARGQVGQRHAFTHYLPGGYTSVTVLRQERPQSQFISLFTHSLEKEKTF